MMTNLFSSFHPTSNNFNIPMNWLSTLLGLLIIPSSYWGINNRMLLLWNTLTSKLYQEFKTFLIGNLNMWSSFLFISFSMILFYNFLGLFPYIFTSSSHLTFTLSMALPLWLSFTLYGWINNSQHMFAHLAPQGTSPILMPFMVCIETISNIIRPLTLAVRLTANMIAGHLLTLLGNTGAMIMNSSILINILMISQILLLILELAVSIIQSYVFAVLTTLYFSEVN